MSGLHRVYLGYDAAQDAGKAANYIWYPERYQTPSMRQVGVLLNKH